MAMITEDRLVGMKRQAEQSIAELHKRLQQQQSALSNLLQEESRVRDAILQTQSQLIAANATLQAWNAVSEPSEPVVAET